MRPSLFVTARLTVFAALGVGACVGAEAPAGPAAAGRLAVDVAALNLEGVGEVVWDLEVVNGAAPTPQVVWQRRVTSSGYGDGAGSASYVGTCDAGVGVAANTVRVWVVGVYEDAVPAAQAGAFNSGDATGVGEVAGSALPFQNPTTPGSPLTRTVPCVEGQDAAVQFDVALMRPAQQGFFDIAVSFNDVFCSAKFDCCQDATGNGCATDGSEDIRLLFDASGARARTFVLGLACTAGTASGTQTELYLSAIALDCSSPHSGTDFAAEIAINPAAGPGNLCEAGNLTACPAITLGGALAQSRLYQLATFRGVELLESGGQSAHKTYWNLAFGVKSPAIAACRLRATATADDAADAGDNVDGGVVAAGTVYPYLQWDVALDASCGSEALSFGVEGEPVTTRYTAAGGGETAFAYGFGATMPANGFCDPLCVRGSCVAGSCVCPDGWDGEACEHHIPECGDGIVEGSETCDGACPVSCTDADACTADGLTGAAATCDVVCAHTPITACAGGDGCCPGGCTGLNDSDCLPVGCAASFASCRAILDAGCSTGNGSYTVDFDGAGGAAPLTVHCDMSAGGFTYRTTDTTAIALGYYQLVYNDGGPFLPSGCPHASLKVDPLAAAQATNCSPYTWNATQLNCLRARNTTATASMAYYGDVGSGACVFVGDLCPGVPKSHYLRYRCR